MVERTVTTLPKSEQLSTQQLPNSKVIIDPNHYKTSLKAKLRGSPQQIFNYLKNQVKKSDGWPGYKAKILRQHQPEKGLSAIIDYKEDTMRTRKEGKRFQLESAAEKWFDDAYLEKKQINWKVRAFDMIYPIRELGTIEITNDDLQGAEFTMTQKLVLIESSDEKKSYSKYKITFRINNCKKRNIALEALQLFRDIATAHVEHMKSNFSDGFFKTVGKFVSNIKVMSLSESIEQASQKYSLFRAALKAFNSNSSKWIYHKDYNLKDQNRKKIRMPKKAENVGYGFKSQSRQTIFRQIINSLETNMDFVKNSRTTQDQYLAFVPDDQKFNQVKEVTANNWQDDSFFCHELINGVNPFSVQVVDHVSVKINQEFIQLKDENNMPVVEQYNRGDLFVCKYPELRPYVYPNSNSDLKREIMVMEPEILFGVKDNKFILLGIGFYFGKDGTIFEVFSPQGCTWRGQSTPTNMWILAKAHALCADSQTHEIIMHLGMSHLFCEAFAVAHHNTYRYKGNQKLKGCKHIGDLLAPHFINLLAINTLGRETLIAKVDDQLSEFFGIQGSQFPSVFGEWFQTKDNIWNTNVGFYDELKTRGFDKNFRHGDKYRYFRDGRMVYEAIHRYAEKSVNAFYKSDESIIEDQLLQHFFKEIHDEDRGDVPSFPERPESKSQLTNILAKLIWQLSAYHSVTNFSQATSYSYLPLRCSGMRQPMPRVSTYLDTLKKSYIDESQRDVSLTFVQASLLSNSQFLGALAIVNNLTTRTVPSLLHMRSPFLYQEHSDDNGISLAEKAFESLKTKLNLIEKDITQTNKNAKYPYIYLLPSNIDASISI
eukprot:403348136